MQYWFLFGALELLMVGLVAAVSIMVAAFSRRYMDGDKRASSFYVNLAALTVSVLVLVTANHVVALFAGWFLMGFFLTRLIGHVKGWPAAKASEKIAYVHFAIASIALFVALDVLVGATGAWTVSEILAQVDQLSTNQLWLAGGFLSVAALVQSAIFPAHRWLMTSMNAPTPVSAFMHAGIVNAGGFLIVRFFELYLALPVLLTIVFAIGAISAMVGTLWMFVQADVKRSLGSSTVAQMGFMMVQCGLGLFTAAIVHLMLHGFFKAFHFLSAGSMIENPKLPQATSEQRNAGHIFLMLLGGIVGGWLFALLTGKQVATLNGEAFLVAFAAFAGAQAMDGFAAMRHWAMLKRALVGLMLVSVAIATYAALFNGVNFLLPINQAQPLTLIHGLILVAFMVVWLAFLSGRLQRSERLYMQSLNTAQPPISTTMHDRSSYVS